MAGVVLGEGGESSSASENLESSSEKITGLGGEKAPLGSQSHHVITGGDGKPLMARLGQLSCEMAAMWREIWSRRAATARSAKPVLYRPSSTHRPAGDTVFGFTDE